MIQNRYRPQLGCYKHKHHNLHRFLNLSEISCEFEVRFNREREKEIINK